MWHDLRHSIRSLRKTPSFTVAAVLTLALGLGVNIAVFSLLNAALIESLPVRHADRLVRVYSVTNEWTGTVAPLPGNTVGVDGRGELSSPRSTSSVAAECHGVGVLLETHMPKPLVRRLWRRMPMAWNGPVIHRSMWLRAEAVTELLTATLPLLPAMSPPLE